MILGDYHTHTVFSHGKDQIIDNVVAAKNAGLQEVAISDHGLGHIAFGVRRKEIAEMRRQIDQAQEQNPEVRVLFGIEANLRSFDGSIDMKKEEDDYFDVILAGYHKFIWAKNVKESFTYVIGSMWRNKFGYSKKYLQKYTDAYIKAIKSGRIDVITHLNYGVKTDVKQVAQAAKDYGVILELNGKRISMTDEEVMEIVNIGPKLIVNSDAHSKERVGDFEVPMSLVERLGIDKKLIVNWNDLPDFKKRKK